MKITHEEWLAELAKLSARSDEGLTGKEWAERLGLSLRVTLERLNAARAQGWLRVGRRSITRIDGRPTTSPVYLVVKPK